MLESDQLRQRALACVENAESVMTRRLNTDASMFHQAEADNHTSNGEPLVPRHARSIKEPRKHHGHGTR